MHGGVDLVRRAQAVGQRLQLIAAAGGEQEMAAFLGKGFGGGRANALGGAGDQDALAAQMQVHGISRLGEAEVREWGCKLLGLRRRDRSTLHCSVAPRFRFGPLQSDQLSGRAAAAATRNLSMSSKKQYRIAVIPGDGIGKEVVPEGLRVLEAAAKKHGVDVHFDHFDFASWDYYEKHGQMMPDDWKDADRQARRDLFRRGRLAGENSRSRFAVGLADQVPPGVRPVRQSAPGAADARRAVAARQPQARRHRFLGGAREHRGRVFLRRRPHVPGHRPRIRARSRR